MAKEEKTEYFDVAGHPELSGVCMGEILTNDVGFSLYLRTSQGKTLTQSGRGDIVILNISRAGWQKVKQTVDSLGPDATMHNVKRTLSESPFLSAVEEVIQR